MTSDKVKKIIDLLIEETKNKEIVWTLEKSIFNSETRYNYEATKGDTQFKIEVDLDSSYNLEVYHIPFFIKNKNLPNGSLFVSNYSNLKFLAIEIYNTNIYPNLSIKNKDKAIDDILNLFDDKTKKREKSINTILDNNELDELNDNSNSSEKSSFFKKLFKR